MLQTFWPIGMILILWKDPYQSFLCRGPLVKREKQNTIKKVKHEF